MNIGLVGTGAIAAQHVAAFQELGGVGFRWVVSRREDAARDFSRQWGFEQSGTDLEVALRDSSVDLVVITSPSELHAEQTILSLHAGKNVLVEIPAALNLLDAERVAELAGKLGLRVDVCHTMRSFPGIREVRRRVQMGKLHIRQIAGHFAIPRRRNQGMNGKARSWRDNLLWHHGCHMVDVAMWVLGTSKVGGVSAILDEPSRETGMIMDVALQFRSEDGPLVNHTLTYNAEHLCWEVRFIGQEETLTYRNGSLLDENGGSVVPYASWVDLRPQNKAILESFTSGVSSEYEIGTVLPAMRVLHEAEISATTNARDISPREGVKP